MSLNVFTKNINLPDGREITIETGKLAKQADGSVVVRMGDTMLLATVVSSKDAMDGIDFLPLSVDYQEKFASAGRIPGGFLKREGRLSDFEVLVSRLVDRAIRPLFPSDYHADTQVMIQLISADKDALPDQLAALAASAALTISDIPFNGPISEVRVVRHENEYLVNPTPEQLDNADIDLIVAATMENILMVEGEMDEVSESEMLEAMKVAHDAIRTQCQAQLELASEMGVGEKREYCHEDSDEELRKELFEKLYARVYAIFEQHITNKNERKQTIKAVKEAYLAELAEDHEVDLSLVDKYFNEIEKKAAREYVLDTNIRIDGRKPNEVRPVWCEVDYLPTPHGSAVFTRGETQSLCTVTLGTKLDEQIIDRAMVNDVSRFLLHYNFPGFSTGEVRPNRGPGRREVGHGNLALRALKQVLPPKDENPYTIRIVSDILESNGSSSMATVCGGTLALMDAGIAIKRPVSGIAMGMISDSETGRYAILSDILGDEDHLGDMDFKVTGTEKGITACQMDIKVDGLSYEVLETALMQANEGRNHILGEMLKVMPETREDFKPNAPRTCSLYIHKDTIGALIGPGGKVVQEIQAETNTTIVIEEVDGKGLVNIFASNQDDMDKAVTWVKNIVAMPEVGEVYEAKVKSIMPFGAFVEFLPNKEGLLHISEIKRERLENMDGVLEVGEMIKVKLIDIDKKTGKFKLSRKVLLPKPERSGNGKSEEGGNQERRSGGKGRPPRRNA
ncbi:polyribonucleotide nucleotidyltransferase [Aureibacter tunicatorum]|uniref:Polyribonucleotide nucleotidyltransferase n=1 Tax=Aureibacter tunicatorum TaxID=866807 RepID=A0AAE3XSY5_9BACT|nr:polyribonucleotide nucleotidyltransferase [Aureibacter tunicatorum]MDR6241306.1 polyribonucleotide nucleotidyltransferase [Aureibacter tunicatorum]BDD03565.1 polyribonucleotide nucleotidyltransferase [Aureibacter tunicatorum]